MTYTTFHIGIYISLITALMGAGIFGSVTHGVLRLAVGCFLLAGICGGVIGSSIPDYSNFQSFSEAKLGFWGIKLFRFQTWARIEHLAFWTGILPLALMFLWSGSAGFDTGSHSP